MASRRVRAFKRWMTSNGIQHTDALQFPDDDLAGISVFSTRHLPEGEIVATIPKKACLTNKTTGAAHIIESAGLEGCLGLSVAIMYERSLGSDSPWAGYLQLLPFHEDIPLVWSLDEVDSLLCGTELHKNVKEDKAHVHDDWKDCILPLIDSENFALDPMFFRVEDYFAAKSLVASRSFHIDDYHGDGMVPLADLFNHKTGAEDVHFTSVDSDDSEEDISDGENSSSDELETRTSETEENGSVATVVGHSSSDGPGLQPQDMADNPLVLEMILVKDVEAGAEVAETQQYLGAPLYTMPVFHKWDRLCKVFNTYGSVGNAALLHRYGFTELDNPFDLVNIDMELVVKWSLSLITSRRSRARISLWRSLGYAGCVSDDSEYFEISHDGEPQFELLILLYIILLSEEEYTEHDLTLATKGDSVDSAVPKFSYKTKLLFLESSELDTDVFLTKGVCKALLALADMRESLYGIESLEADKENLNRCDCRMERKLYHSLVLRVSEKRIIQKLRQYSEKGVKSLGKTSHVKKKLKSKA